MQQMSRPERGAKPVPALVRFNAIMDALSADPRPRGVSELARELGLARSTVHGLCKTLAEFDILTRVTANEFSIGPKVLTWSNAFAGQNSVTRVFNAMVEMIKGPDALNLSILSGRDVMYIGYREGSDPLAMRFREGLRLPAVYTATGKAMLSTLPDDEVVELFAVDWPPPLTSKSVRTIDELLSELAETRARGYSIDNEQLRDSLVSTGAPVYAADSHARAVAGISIAMLEGRATPEAIERTGKRVIGIAAELSRRLGAR